MAGERPELKIVIKDVETGERVDLFACWRRDNGRLSGALDRRIKGMRIVLEDGTKVDLYRRPDGKHTHYIDAYEERSAPTPDARDRAGSRSQYGRGREEPPPDDFGEDDIPF